MEKQKDMKRFLFLFVALCLLGSFALAEEMEKGSFLFRVWNRSGVEISYLRCDFFVGHEYKGLAASCPNAGEDFYRVPYTPETPEELENLRIECSYGVSNLSPEDAILQLMMGKPAEEHGVEGPDLQPEAGKVYNLSLVMMDGDMNLVLNELSLPEDSDRNGLGNRESSRLWVSASVSTQTDLADLTETSFGLQLLSLLELYSLTRYVP